ncbi:hypothetical protein KY289_001396 [Solanum tuberosum]|nr:hypothetical protein KY289_001396 [Solanum tuberosum]
MACPNRKGIANVISNYSRLEQEPSKETVDNELVVFDGVDGGGIDVGAGVDVGGDIGVGARQDQGATSCRRCSGFLCENGEDFRTMTSIKIWWEDWYIDEILTLMRERHVRYPEYDSADRILDLNFYFNFKLSYDKISEEATTVGGISLTQLINKFEWNEDMINYVKGISPYLGGMDWIGEKWILTVMNMNKTHFCDS